MKGEDMKEDLKNENTDDIKERQEEERLSKTVVALLITVFCSFALSLLFITQETYPEVVKLLFQGSAGAVSLLSLTFLCKEIRENKGLRECLFYLWLIFLVLGVLCGGTIYLAISHKAIFSLVGAFALGLTVISFFFTVVCLI